MIIKEAVPRLIDTRSSLGVDASEIARQSTVELLARFPEVHRIPVDELVTDAARCLEMLALALQEKSETAFIDHVRWWHRMRLARGIPSGAIDEHVRIIAELVTNRSRRNSQHAVRTLVAAARAALSDEHVEESRLAEDTVISIAADRLLGAMLGGDREAAHKAMADGIASGMKVLDCYVGVIQPVMHKIGRLWESNSISVAQEHLATALLPSVMAYCRTHFRGKSSTHGTMALTGVEGELHEVGIQVVGDVALADGWNIRYLGTNAPASEIIGYLQEHTPDVIGVGITMPCNLGAARELVTAIRNDHLLRNTEIYVGGAAAHLLSTAWQSLGVHSEENLDAGRFVTLLREHVS